MRHTCFLMIIGLLWASCAAPVRPSVERRQPLAKVDSDRLANTLSAAVRIPSVTGSPATNFDAVEALLRNSFPLTFSRLVVQAFPSGSLLLEWPGRDRKKLPYLLLGHIDVVPVEAGTESDWVFPPFSGEIAHHRDHPFQIHVGQFVPTLLGITPPGHPGSDYAPVYASDTFIRTWLERDKTQVTLGITQLLGPKLGASQVAISMEAANLYIHDMPDKNEVRLQTPGVALLQYAPQDALADKNSWGYRLAGVFTYNNVLGAFQVSPRTIFSQDVTGNSPGGQPFQEGRKSLTLGVNVKYINRLSADLSYTSFYGAGDFNVLGDRDFANFSLRYSF